MKAGRVYKINLTVRIEPELKALIDELQSLHVDTTELIRRAARRVITEAHTKLKEGRAA